MFGRLIAVNDRCALGNGLRRIDHGGQDFVRDLQAAAALFGDGLVAYVEASG